MPLNPNGKIDKPALPFPDTATAGRNKPRANGVKPTDDMTPMQSKLHEIWRSLLPSAPAQLPLDESFFDLGGHSILATRLIFQIRNDLAIKAPLGVVFDHPTLRGLSAELDRLGSDDFGLVATGAAQPTTVVAPPTAAYADDLTKLLSTLPTSFASPSTRSPAAQTVFLTGATGFLGVFILRDLLQRSANEIAKVICLIRASSNEAALDRLREAASSRGAWSEDWVASQRLEVVAGTLEADLYGLTPDRWTKYCQGVDTVVHNGALVSVGLEVWSSANCSLPGPLDISLQYTETDKCGRHCHCDEDGRGGQSQNVRFRVDYVCSGASCALCSTLGHYLVQRWSGSA